MQRKQIENKLTFPQRRRGSGEVLGEEILKYSSTNINKKKGE